MRLNLSSLVYDLPEDVRRLKDAGEFDRLAEILDARIASPRTSAIMRDRFIVEKELLPRWEPRFPYDPEAALAKIRTRIPDFTEEEFNKYELDGCMDYIFIKGVKHYVSSFASTLIKMNPELAARDTQPPEDDGININAYIADIKKNGEAAYRYTVKSTLTLDDDKFEAGETYLTHIPVPAPCAQQNADEIEIVTDGTVAKPDAHFRTAYWVRKMDENKPFEVTFSYTSRLKYVDPMNDKPYIVYPNCLPVSDEDLEEQWPCAAFTPYMRQLAKEIVGDEKRPLYIAKKIYDYITLNVRYSFMRSYILVDKHAEFAATNMKGDCGIQALMFITLCRICGVPARWQSGLTVDPKTTGDHDWAQFYTEEWGWLFADPSYGGAGTRQDNEEKRQFYFGNLDPYRMIANRRAMSEYEVPKQHEGYDPYDNQDGEIENEKHGFDRWSYDKTDVTLKFEKI